MTATGRDVSTGHVLRARKLGELHRAGIPTFIVKGNHDAESVMSRCAALPRQRPHLLRRSSGDAADRSAARRAARPQFRASARRREDFVATYPARREGWLNIGVLHTSLDGVRGHDPYAPCTVADLARFGYDYWALGHIHAAEIVCRDPWIVYPGNLQGRSPREIGAKGAMRVTVEDGRIVAVEPIALDAARWAHEFVDVSGVADESRGADADRRRDRRARRSCAEAADRSPFASL